MGPFMSGIYKAITMPTNPAKAPAERPNAAPVGAAFPEAVAVPVPEAVLPVAAEVALLVKPFLDAMLASAV
jgi:hypothetical protein